MQRDPQRLFALDVLRGFAIALVLFRHVPIEPDSSEPVLRFLFGIGWAGVDLFFVLSGFLISGLLYREVDASGTIDFRRFWLRRGMKIWPSYFAVYGGFTLLVLAAAWLRGYDSPVGKVWPNLVFIQNYFPYEIRWPHSWSLAIEEHFYIFLPVLMIALTTRGRAGLRWLPWIGAAVCVLTLAGRWFAAAEPGAAWDDFYYPTHFRADSLLFGVVLGFVAHYHRETFAKIAAFWPALVLGVVPVLALAYLLPLDGPGISFAYTLGFTLLYLGFGGLVVVAGAYPSAGERHRVARAIAWLGVYSYTIYLTHSVIFRLPGAGRLPAFVRQHVLDSPWVDRALFWVLSIATGYLVSRLIERPFLELRKRWLPSAASRERPRPQAPLVPSPSPVGLTPVPSPYDGEGNAAEKPGVRPQEAEPVVWLPTMRDRRRVSRVQTH